MADALLTGSQRVVPKKLVALNYSFQFPKLQAALERSLDKLP
jgi:NAD dependent epimerase/dehydratase family enzyme